MNIDKVELQKIFLEVFTKHPEAAKIFLKGNNYEHDPYKKFES